MLGRKKKYFKFCPRCNSVTDHTAGVESGTHKCVGCMHTHDDVSNTQEYERKCREFQERNRALRAQKSETT